jgi:hypothetical protein
MTRRYGRNQRRQAREALALQAQQLALVEEQKSYLYESLSLAQSQVAALRAQLEHIAFELIDLVGEQSAILPIDLTKGPRFDDIRKWPVKVRVSPAVGRGAGIPVRDTYRVVDLLKLVASVRRDPERYGVFIRFRDANDMGVFNDSVLFVSLDQFRRSRLKPADVDHLMKFVRARFVEELCHG